MRGIRVKLVLLVTVPPWQGTLHLQWEALTPLMHLDPPRATLREENLLPLKECTEIITTVATR